MQPIKRTTGCGQVNRSFLDNNISLAGWVHRRRDHGGLIFVDLRDRTGLMQLVFNPELSQEAHEAAHALRSEFVIAVSGVVIQRDAKTVNADLPTGQWELVVNSLTILNSSKTPPFAIDDTESIDEEVRLTYRYMDLRRPAMHAKFAMRNKAIFEIRRFFQEQEFYEIETPILTKNTPEGAREFLVPARQNPGLFYVLPQSPQLYKQLLMASGMEKYYQIARCFRDEDLRADRQPEFTQLDVEMSFINESDIQSLIETMLARVFKSVLNIDVPTPFVRMTYDTAFRLYGSDKPDLRFGLPITDISSLFATTELQFLRSVLDKGGKVGALHVVGNAFSHSELNRWVEKAQQLGAKGLLWIHCKDEQTIESPVHKFLPADFFAQLKKLFPDAQPGSTFFIIAGDYAKMWPVLGQLRLAIAHSLNLIPDDVFNFSWITDFPLFEYDEKEKRWSATHHPFTAPEEGYKEKEVGKIKARAYDVVLNGVELGGGSIRLHNRKQQEEVFELLGLSMDDMQTKFGFLLRAQEYGFPPHGGIALGLDRMLMMMTQSHSIREVIAFPKTQRGYDLMMDAPTAIEDTVLKEYGIKKLQNLNK